MKANLPAIATLKSFFLCLFLFACVLIDAASAEQSKDVSMSQLVADPQRFDGHLVRVVAFLHVEFEGTILYLHREDFEKSIFQNSIWLDLAQSQEQSSKKLSNGYVRVEGVFSAKEKGHLDICAGSLRDIVIVEKWSIQRR